MQIELSSDDVETIIREADAAAQRLRRKLCLPICEREDLGQDLLVDLLRRLPAYNPSRGSIGAFANIVLRNQSSRIAMRHHRQRRAQGGSLLSLEVPLAEAAPLASGVQRRVQPGPMGQSIEFLVPSWPHSYARGRSAGLRQRQGRIFGKPPGSRTHSCPAQTPMNAGLPTEHRW